jgi:ABC-2 type transport system permease protein
LILSRFGSIPYGENYTGIFGFFLYGAACIAITLFISSLTESQIIAAVLSFAALFVGYIMNGITGLISSTGNIITKILNCFDLITPFNNFIEGTFDVTAVVYYLSIIFIMLFLTCQGIQKRRFSISTKNLTLGAFSSTMIVIAVAITIIVNLVVAQLPSTITSIDMTEDKLYSITDTTKDLVSTLEDEVVFYVIADKDNVDATLLQTIEKFDDLSEHILVEYKDPVISPDFYKTYTDEISEGSVIVVSGEKSKVIDINDVYEYEMDSTTYEYNVTGYDGEGLLTSAISYVTSENTAKAYIIEGHNELALEDTFLSAIEKENITTETINLLQYDTVPEDATFLIINAPTTDFSEEDTTKIMDYLNNGGNLFVTSSYSETDLPNFDSIIQQYGITIADGMVVEGDTNYYNQVPFYLLPEVANDTVTNGVYNTYYVFVPYAQGIILPETATDGIEITDLLTTSSDAFSKIDVSNMDSYDKSLGDIDGPFSVGVRISNTLNEMESTVYLFTSESIFSAAADEVVSGANSILFSNCIGSFVEDDTISAVPVKSYSIQYVTTTQADIIIIGVCTSIVLPLLSIITGLVIWLRRRKR